MSAEGRDRYLRALQLIRDTKEQHGALHEAFVLVIAKAIGDETVRFYTRSHEDMGRAGIESHAKHSALVGVQNVYLHPESHIETLTKGEVVDTEKNPGFLKRVRNALGMNGVGRLSPTPGDRRK